MGKQSWVHIRATLFLFCNMLLIQSLDIKSCEEEKKRSVHTNCRFFSSCIDISPTIIKFYHCIASHFSASAFCVTIRKIINRSVAEHNYKFNLLTAKSLHTKVWLLDWKAIVKLIKVNLVHLHRVCSIRLKSSSKILIGLLKSNKTSSNDNNQQIKHYWSENENTKEKTLEYGNEAAFDAQHTASCLWCIFPLF